MLKAQSSRSKHFAWPKQSSFQEAHLRHAFLARIEEARLGTLFYLSLKKYELINLIARSWRNWHGQLICYTNAILKVFYYKSKFFIYMSKDDNANLLFLLILFGICPLDVCWLMSVNQMARTLLGKHTREISRTKYGLWLI